MINLLYLIFIYPIVFIIDISFMFLFRITNNYGISILGVSVLISTLTLPLYFIAEKFQRKEREIQKIMKPEIDVIRSVFSGDERFLRLSAYYRQNKYHPIFALRSSISIMIQIPFFIAAFHYLSNLEIINGISFGPIPDLALPDSLIYIGSFNINILPLLMTIISCISAFVYTKSLPKKESIQLYGMALLFLILLYNSPSALVLYWTGNNLFSLIKNLIQKSLQKSG